MEKLEKRDSNIKNKYDLNANKDKESTFEIPGIREKDK